MVINAEFLQWRQESICHTAKYTGLLSGRMSNITCWRVEKSPILKICCIDMLTLDHVQIPNFAGRVSTSTGTDLTKGAMDLAIGVADLPASSQSSMQPAELSSKLIVTTSTP